MKRRRLVLRREVVAQLTPLVLAEVRGGQLCSDPTCQICDTIKPQPGCC